MFAVCNSPFVQLFTCSLVQMFAVCNLQFAICSTVHLFSLQSLFKCVTLSLSKGSNVLFLIIFRVRKYCIGAAIDKQFEYTARGK